MKLSVTKRGRVRLSIPWNTLQRVLGSNDTKARKLRADVKISGSGSDNTITIDINPDGKYALQDRYNYPSNTLRKLDPDTTMMVIEIPLNKLRLEQSECFKPIVCEQVETQVGDDPDTGVIVFTPDARQFRLAKNKRAKTNATARKEYKEQIQKKYRATDDEIADAKKRSDEWPKHGANAAYVEDANRKRALAEEVMKDIEDRDAQKDIPLAEAVQAEPTQAELAQAKKEIRRRTRAIPAIVLDPSNPFMRLHGATNEMNAARKELIDNKFASEIRVSTKTVTGKKHTEVVFELILYG